jgi:hypothetical protein
LANGNADEFVKGEQLFRSKAVSQSLQIGFHLSATVTIPIPTSSGAANVVLNVQSNANAGGAGGSNSVLAPSGAAAREASAKAEKLLAATNANTYHVAITFDRRRIISCTCTCNGSASWCNHIVAVCLHRIHYVSI